MQFTQRRSMEMFHEDNKTVFTGKELLPLEMRDVPEFFSKKGEAELHYTPSVRERCLRELKEAITSDNILRNQEFNDNFLLQFLNSRKYNVEATVLQIKCYLKFRSKHLFVYTDVKFDELSPLLDIITPLPWRCPDGCAVILIRLGNWNAEKHPIIAMKKMTTFILVQSLCEPMTQINGFKIIFDHYISLQTLRLFTPQNMMDLYNGMQAAPGRFKEYHVVNLGGFGRRVLNIVNLFLTDKMKKRVHIHESVDTLKDFFPRSVLPMPYGGDLKDYDMTEWLRKAATPEELAYFNILSN